MSLRRLSSLLLGLALVTAACGSSTPPASPSPSAVAAVCGSAPDPGPSDGWGPQASGPTLVPIIVANAITCGQVRFMFLFLDSSNRVASAPGRTAKVSFYNLGRDPNKVVATGDGVFVWTIQDSRGMYILSVDLPEAGTWGAEFTTQAPGSPAETSRSTFSVLDIPTAVAIGQKAPASKTPTAADVGGDLTKLSTDTKPDPIFYGTSVADALVAKKPFMLIFATPKFCVSQQCGPTLDHFKPIAAAHPEVTFINVEPYKLEVRDGSLQPILGGPNKNALVATDVTNAWGILSEPWIFAIDRSGIVRGSYSLTITDDELRSILPMISAGG